MDELRPYAPAYFDFYEMGMEAWRLKNMRGVNGTVILLDSTVDKWHDNNTNPNIQKFESVCHINQTLFYVLFL